MDFSRKPGKTKEKHVSTPCCFLASNPDTRDSGWNGITAPFQGFLVSLCLGCARNDPQRVGARPILLNERSQPCEVSTTHVGEGAAGGGNPPVEASRAEGASRNVRELDSASKHKFWVAIRS